MARMNGGQIIVEHETVAGFMAETSGPYNPDFTRS
jgi:hypothetical protein